MRSLFIALSIVTFASPALAHDTGEEHEHDFGKPKQKGAFAITGAFGGLLGPSLGGEYEECEAPTNCYDRKRPFSTYLEGRFSYQLPGRRVGFEAGIGYIGNLNMRVARETTLIGEQSTPVSVNITDDVSMSGAFATAGVSFAFIQKPLVFSGVFSIGNWWAALETKRTGTAVTAEAPSPREMKGVSKEETASMILVIPELRLAYPVLANLHVGLSLGSFYAFGESRPKVVQTPVATPTDPQPAVPGDPRRAIGFVPQTNATPQSAMDSPILFRSALFVSGVF